jgi:hypothetical protein
MHVVGGRLVGGCDGFCLFLWVSVESSYSALSEGNTIYLATVTRRVQKHEAQEPIKHRSSLLAAMIDAVDLDLLNL